MGDARDAGALTGVSSPSGILTKQADCRAAGLDAGSADVESGSCPIAGSGARRRGPGCLTWAVTEGDRGGQGRGVPWSAEMAAAAALERVSDAVFSVDRDFVYTYANASAARLVGSTPELLMGRSLWDTLSQDQRIVVEASCQDAWHTQKVTDLEVHVADADAWFATRIFPSPEGLTVVQHQLTTRGMARKTAAEVVEALRAQLESSRDEFFRVDAAGVIVWCGGGIHGVLGYSPDELVGRRGDEFVHPDDVAQLQATPADGVSRLSVPRRVRVLAKDGAVRWVEVAGSRVHEGSDGRSSLVGGWRDVTAEQEALLALRESEQRFRLLAENSTDVVLRSRGNAVVWVSPSLTRTLGWAPEDWIGHSLAEFGNRDDHDLVTGAQERLTAGGTARFRIRFADVHGEWHWFDAHAQEYRNDAGELDGYLSSLRLVDNEVEAQRLLEQRATYDDLTGALKRGLALERLQELGRHARNPGTATAVMFIDVDGFKHVNDTYGHSAGDLLLQTFVARIRACIRADDDVARMGGDEFLVIVTGIHHADEAVAIAHQLRLACSQPISMPHAEMAATVSIGVSVGPSRESVDAMVARADDLMYEAKAAGRNRVVVAWDAGDRGDGSASSTAATRPTRPAVE